MRRLWPTVVLSLYIGILIGCAGSSGSSGNQSSPPPTVTLSAQPPAIIAGQSATLTWTSSNASSATLNGTNVATSGTTTVSPSQTTTYTITVNGAGGTASANTTMIVTHGPPAVKMSASPGTIIASQTSTLTVAASNAINVVITDNLDSNRYVLPASGGTQNVTPTKTITYTATANGADNQTKTATVTVKVNPGSLQASVNHIIFLMQENRSFDHYFGMLNPYRQLNHFNVGDDGVTYNVDGIEDKLTTITNVNDEGQVFSLFKLKSTCIDDDSAAWLPSFGDVNRYDFSASRPINMDGFVHTAEGYAKHCADPASKCQGGQFTDVAGQRAMGYYDQDYFNYYYYMASQFALSDRWFSPVASESIPNRLATMTGGTTQGLVWDPGRNDNLPQLSIRTIFEALDDGGVPWKIYYSTTDDTCYAGDNSCGNGKPLSKMPSTSFRYFRYSNHYVHSKAQGACNPPLQNSGTAIGDPNDDFCIDPARIAPISQFIADMKNGSLPSFAWVVPAYSHTDEHPGSGQPILAGQAAIANLFNIFMASPSWNDSIFFLSYDEAGGPYDHVPPVPGHTNDFTNPNLGITTDISSIAVNPDSYFPCAPPNPNPPGPATLHCDLHNTPFADPGVNPTDAAAIQGFAAQLGFRLPNMVISPFVRRHYVSHIPMDHTAIIKLVETRFLNGQPPLTSRDAAQPDLLDFFDFATVPWLTPPINVPVPTNPALGNSTCTANNM